MRHLKKILFSLVLLISLHSAFSQPGNTNYYRTRVRYYNIMGDSLVGIPKDTFNLRTQYALSQGWNNYVWFASKGDITYMWSIAQQRWIATNIPLVSNITVINDSTIQICNNDGCDTINFNINTSVVITNVSIVNDSTVLVCTAAGSCDTVIFHITQPPITTVTILNDSTIVVCNASGCDTIVISNPSPPITSVTIINDSTIEICNAGGCDTITINSPPNVTIINDSTFVVCNTLGCDTIIVGPDINITIINDSTIQICGSNVDGPELVNNGDFNGNATGWELGALWAYNTNHSIVHSFGSTQATAQAGGLVQGGTYRVTADILGGSNGTVDIKLDAGTSHTYAAGAGTVTFVGTWSNANNYKIVLAPSNDFDGAVTNVSIKQILPNCDTIQIQPTFFLDTVHIFVEPPLHARNDSTFYMTRSTKVDSGFLANEDFTYFWHKVDSIYFHPSVSGVDSFFYDNGDTTVLWYTNDVLANGIISGGQVIFSGTPYVYNITPAVYRLNGIRYTSPATQITIDSADGSLPRTDVFYVDTSGNAGYLPGIAANPNLKPRVDVSWQLELTSVDLTPTNPPAIVDSTIYNENVAPEWIPVTSPGTTANANNLLNPWLGVKSIDVVNINAGDYLQFPHTGPFDMSTFLATNGSLTGFILLKQAIPSSASLRAQWFNGGTPVTPLVTIPLVKNNTVSYQGFSVPLSSFSFVSNVVTNLHIQYTNSSATNNAGFFLDDINLQSGIPPTPASGNALIRVTRRAGTDSVMGTYQDGTISYQFKDSSTAPATVMVGRNGITDSVDRYILGGTLYKNTTINALGFSLIIPGTINGNVLDVSNSNNNNVPAIKGTATGTSGTGVWGSATQFGAGVTGTGVTGPGVIALSTANYAVNASGLLGANIIGNSTSTNTATEIATFARQVTGGVGAAGVGGFINISIEDDGGNNALTNQLVSTWLDPVHATRTSQLDIKGVNSATTNTIMSIHGSGVVGIGESSGFFASRLQIKDDGLPGGTSMVFLYSASTSNGTLLGVQGVGSTAGIASGTDDGYAITGNSKTVQAAYFQRGPTTDNDIVSVIRVGRSSQTGSGAAGAGAAISYDLIDAGGFNTQYANELTSEWVGTPTHLAATSKFKIKGMLAGSNVDVFTANSDGSWDIRPITATQASAITPTEGKLLFVSNTNGTFTSIGLWCYENGAWSKK